MHSADGFQQGIQTAELAGLGAYVRAVFLTAQASSPDVVGLAVRVTVDAGLSVIEAEYLDANGRAAGGFGL